MQHDAITRDKFLGIPSPAIINAGKKAYRDTLAKHGLTPDDVRKFKQSGETPTQRKIPQPSVTGFENDIASSMQNELILMKLGLSDWIESITNKNAAKLRYDSLSDEINHLQYQWGMMDCTDPQRENLAIQIRSLIYEQKSVSVRM